MSGAGRWYQYQWPKQRNWAQPTDHTRCRRPDRSVSSTLLTCWCWQSICNNIFKTENLVFRTKKYPDRSCNILSCRQIFKRCCSTKGEAVLSETAIVVTFPGFYLSKEIHNRRFRWLTNIASVSDLYFLIPFFWARFPDPIHISSPGKYLLLADCCSKPTKLKQEHNPKNSEILRQPKNLVLSLSKTIIRITREEIKNNMTKIFELIFKNNSM